MTSRTSTSQPPSDAHRVRVTLQWLIRLRGYAILGQTMTVLAAAVLLAGLLPLGGLCGLLGVAAASQIGLKAWAAHAVKSRHDGWWEEGGGRLMTGVLLADVVLLTALLGVSGGPSNPFAVFYLVYVVVAAVALSLRQAVAVGAVTLAGYALLFVWSNPIAALEHHHGMHGPHIASEVCAPAEVGASPAAGDHAGHGHARAVELREQRPDAFSLHLQGMLVAFAMAAVLLIGFVSRLATQLRRRDREVLAERERANRAERLQSVATMAAGAAHELSSPLSTIAVIGADLQRLLDRGGVPPERLREDLDVLRTEVGVCRSILDDLAGAAGQAAGESFHAVSIASLVEQVRASDPALVVEVADEVNTTEVVAPGSAVVRAIASLVRNAREAGAATVTLTATRDHTAVQLSLVDDGAGMPPDILAKLGEPFFSTKEPGRGLGLGVHLAMRLFSQLGGSLLVESTPGRGTVVRMQLPLRLPSPPPRGTDASGRS